MVWMTGAHWEAWSIQAFCGGNGLDEPSTPFWIMGIAMMTQDF